MFWQPYVRAYWRLAFRSRAAVFVRTLHPNVAGRRFEWRLGEPVTIAEMPYRALEIAPFVDSPVPRVCIAGEALRCRPHTAPRLSDYPALKA